ncbi:alpha/beta fold hydrolase [Sutcliffiella rhizosphaerae]|uniref:(E)-2-((N-methylformamido)methylene)succinate hydrolase n=1 Tax=Sutcliffiella rhizosphaerae TaxID=2880967 RepID=A0ABM8YLN4_9BACI|nr:alpha/beta hydrolase [Sutcliffiella rhizosphaerae]CAG9620649.1 (E)-2-((N-methylformamido)methylene)succinate hydrolase [Sutcliffiella rhizosphaerae]
MYYKTMSHPKSKEWIVLFHGFGGNSSIFYKQLKAFRSEYNLLLLDFPGHGKSPYQRDVNLFEYSAEKTIEIINHLKIKTAHFVGLSLGTIIMQEIAIRKPEIIKSMVLGGATPKLKKWGEFLCRLSVFYPLRKILPHMVPYRIFARVLLPKRNHSSSREAFIKEAYKLSKETYLGWVLAGLDGYTTFDRLKEKKNSIPKLYISGSEDHMFLHNTINYVNHERNASIEVIPKCGHVCNIEESETFNTLSVSFMKRVDKISITA